MIKRFLLLLLFVLLPKGLFATITQSGTTSISGTTGWMYINSADDGSGNTYWNNTSYYMTCEFTVPNTPDANFAIKLAIDTDDDGDYVNESWVTIGAEYTGGTTTFLKMLFIQISTIKIHHLLAMTARNLKYTSIEIIKQIM